MDMYGNKFVMSVLVNGVPQQELADSSVTIPFGSEYTLRFRNKNNRRAVVHVTIDGENVSEGGFVIPANSYIDIERPANVSKKFKFVGLDSPDAVDFGKNGPNTDRSKGVISAKFHLEKEWVMPPVVKTVIEEHHHHHHHDHYPRPRRDDYPYPWVKPIWCGIDGGNQQMRSRGMSLRGGSGATFSANATSMSEKYDDAVLDMAQETLSRDASWYDAPKDGCTVEGGSSSQSFSTTYVNTENSYTELKIVLKGLEPKVTVLKETKVVKRVENDPDPVVDSRLEEEQNKIAELELRIAEAKRKKLEAELEALTK